VRSIGPGRHRSFPARAVSLGIPSKRSWRACCSAVICLRLPTAACATDAGPPADVPTMDIHCPRCGGVAEPVGHEDARAFFQCPLCKSVWASRISAIAARAGSGERAPCVVVADDSSEMLALLSAWLEEEGCVVVAVGTGREATDASTAYRPDVVILDLVLPAPDGFQVCQTLSRRGGPAVVLMTGMTNPDPQKVRDSGALLLLKKPFCRETLIEALTVALEHSRRDEELET
jgi:CheY-like chemotaxis protein